MSVTECGETKSRKNEGDALMVTDEMLNAALSLDAPAQLKELSKSFSLSEEEVHDALAGLAVVKEMAAELLAYREAERKENSWDDAPPDAIARIRWRTKWEYITPENPVSLS
jgi:hypothetical protein